MSSFSTKLSAVPESCDSHYGTCRMEPKYLFTSSSNCDASRLIRSDHLYDMPQRPDLQIGGICEVIKY